MLVVRELCVRYGPIPAVRGIDLDIAKGEIVALIGANGAGKSSTVRALAGLIPFVGSVALDNRPLRPNDAAANIAAGLVLVPEGRGVLGRMTVEENLLMGAYTRADRSDARAEIATTMERFPILGQRRHALANLLSGGEQQVLAIARALLSRPRLLLLDEPSLGLAPKMVERVFSLISDLRAQGLTVLIVEQKARQALKLADRAYVLETGRLVLSGTAGDLAGNAAVADAFLGGHAQQPSLAVPAGGGPQ